MKGEGICSVPGCVKPRRFLSTGVCYAHYTRKLKHGSYECPPRKTKPLVERFLRFLPSPFESDCWEWKGTVNSQGYGSLIVGKGLGTTPAHRFSYTYFVGRIPDGLQIDHLCRNRRCVNPAHLEPVTSAENTRRGELHSLLAAKAANRKFCKQGHELTEENTYLYETDRRCRTCGRERGREYRQRKRDGKQA